MPVTSGPRGSSTAARSARVQSVDRAVALLRAVAAASGPSATVTALASTCGLNRATAWRILTTLEAQGMVMGDRQTGRYCIGLGLLELAGSAGVDALVQSARPALEQLCLQTGETAGLAVVRDGALVYVDEVAPTAVISATWRGRTVPWHATSTGKAALAFSDVATLERVTGGRLERYTSTTATSPRRLRAELEETRERGFGVCRGEYDTSAWGVSAPVLDTSGEPVAVLSIWGPADRVTEDRLEPLGVLVRDAARSVPSV